MPSPEILPFADEHLAAAGDLLAARHRAHRAVEPLLSPRYEDPEVGPRRGGRRVRAPRTPRAPSPFRATASSATSSALPRSDSAWGPNAWVEAAGHAVEEAETARALYGLAAARWVDEGRTAHYALLPAYDTALDRRLVPPGLRPPAHERHPRARRRRPRPGRPRRAAAGSSGTFLCSPASTWSSPAHQHSGRPSPRVLLDVYEERLADWEEDFDNPKFWNVVVEHDGAIVGCAVGCSLEVSSMHTGPASPDRAAFLGFAAVVPQARGLGVGRALGEAVSAWALSEGYPSIIVTDWRETNLLSSRAWRGLGYRDTFTRVHRLVGH